MHRTLLFGGVAAAVISVAAPAAADSFVNGGFESGDLTGWTQVGGQRSSVVNSALTPTTLVSSSPDAGRGSIITLGTVDPRVGAALGTTVYSGSNSYRVEDVDTGGFGTAISQTVNNYTDANIFFAWKSVLLGAHGLEDAATMVITLRDLTSGTELIRRQYNAASGGGGVDPRFSYDINTNNFYTPQWQIEQLAIGPGLQGHNFELAVLAADCAPTAHWGYVYLDGFGARLPPPGNGGIPEPSTWALAIAGFGMAGAALRRRRMPLEAI